MIDPPTLPIRPLPIDGESFGSYIDRVAADREVPANALLASIGLSANLSPLAIPSNYSALLTETAVTRAAHSLRLDQSQIQQMLLRRYDGIAFDVPTFPNRVDLGMQVFAGREWVYLRQSSACPECLREDSGAWQLAWRLPLVFACLRHRRLLANDCPACRLPLASMRDSPTIPHFVREVPRPGFCANPVDREDTGYGRVPCGYDLGRIETPSLKRWPRLLAAQARLGSALCGEPQIVGGIERTAGEYLHDVRVLAGLMLHVARVADLGLLPAAAADAFLLHEEGREHDNTRNTGNRKRRFVRATPRSPALMAALLPQAVEMLAAPTPSEIAEGLIWVITRSRSVRGRSLARIPTAVQNSSTLRPIWQEAARSLALTRRYWPLKHAAARSYQFEPRHIPQLLWESAFDRHFAELTPERTSLLVMRRFCSMELVAFAGNLSRRDAAAALDLPPGAKATAAAIIGHLRRNGQHELLLARMRELATELDAAEGLVDYAHRRSVLRNLIAVPWNDWREICRQSGADPGVRHAKHRYAAVWLWEAIAGGDYRDAAGLRGRPLHHRSMYTKKFLPRQLPPLESSLRRYGEMVVSS